ncbi:MAG TPA: DNA replication and repair protein RecF, partial [Gemmatimonadaceae bacterium]|nr:DNA replication and repair protein RecF [Gemmatimonadaceae bacterium]
YYLELLRSVRGARDQDLVRFGEAGFHVSGEVAVHGRVREVGVGYERHGRRKRVRVDGAEVPKLSEALGSLPAVMISPRDVSLVSGAPSERRRFLDVALGLTSRRYLTSLQHYRAALLRRNAALREVQRGREGGQRVAVWEPALAQHGAVLWSERLAWVERWAGEFSRLCAAIGERQPATLRYTTGVAPGAAMADALLAALESKRALDVKRGVTHAGPHRDELEVLLDGREARAFGSAGQQRTAAIALRMLEASTLQARVQAAPLLLLDDPFAELDVGRAERILALLGERGMGQTLIAVPRISDIPPELTRLARLRIADGALAPLDA